MKLKPVIKRIHKISKIGKTEIIMEINSSKHVRFHPCLRYNTLKRYKIWDIVRLKTKSHV